MIKGYKFNSLPCLDDKETLPYQNQDDCYTNIRTCYILWDGKFTEEPIEKKESCNDFVAALKSCTPFQGIYKKN